MPRSASVIQVEIGLRKSACEIVRRGLSSESSCLRSVLICCIALRRDWQILLQKSLMASARSDSLIQMRFAVEAGDDGATQARPKAAVLFI